MSDIEYGVSPLRPECCRELTRLRDELAAEKARSKQADAILSLRSVGIDVQRTTQDMAKRMMLERDEAQRQLAAAREALDRYGKHDGLCAIVGGYGYCSCGLDAALSAAPGG